MAVTSLLVGVDSPTLFCLSVVVLFIAGSVLCCMGELHYVYSFSSCWTLGCSQFLAIININKIAVNMHVKKEISMVNKVILALC